MFLAGRQTRLSSDKKEVRAGIPTISSLETVKRIRRLPQHHGPSPAKPAGNFDSVPKRAGSESQTSASSRSPSSEAWSPKSRSCSVMSAKSVKGKVPAEARYPKTNLEIPTSKHFLADSGLQRTTPPVAQLPATPRPHENTTPKPIFNKDVKFRFFLADEQHGAIHKALEKCGTMSSFFDEALAAWGTLGEEHHPTRMIGVKVMIQDVSQPIFVLWRNKEGFEGMMDTISKQAGRKQTQLDVEVHCYKRESLLGGKTRLSSTRCKRE